MCTTIPSSKCAIRSFSAPNTPPPIHEAEGDTDTGMENKKGEE